MGDETNVLCNSKAHLMVSSACCLSVVRWQSAAVSSADQSRGSSLAHRVMCVITSAEEISVQIRTASSIRISISICMYA